MVLLWQKKLRSQKLRQHAETKTTTWSSTANPSIGMPPPANVSVTLTFVPVTLRTFSAVPLTW